MSSYKNWTCEKLEKILQQLKRSKFIYLVKYDYDAYCSIPTSFIVQANCQDSEFYSFVQRYQAIHMSVYSKERIPPKHLKKNIWLVKPAASNQGIT